MTVVTEDLARQGWYIVAEHSGYYGRDEGVLAAGTLKAGAVLGRVTATGKYVAFNPGAADGSEEAAAVLYDGADASGGEVDIVVTARATEVRASALAWADGVTDPQKTAAIASLGALGIVAR